MSATLEADHAQAAQAMSRLMQAHRSIREFAPRDIDPAWLDSVLAEAFAGSSSSGNLNMVSVIRTHDPGRKARLCELHFGQPMVDVYKRQSSRCWR